MAKDPAFLFYSNDFLTGVQDLTMEERGQYITLLCLHHQKGRLTKKVIDLSCHGNATADVLAKFRQDDGGLFFNPRLEEEVEKRKAHSKKQSERAKDGWEKRKNDAVVYATASATAMPLEDENEIVNEDVIKNGSINEKTKAAKIETVDLPFNGEFGNVWLKWVEYKKKEHRFSYKTRESQQAALSELVKLSGGNEQNAIEIIAQSMANGWKGFFELKKVKSINNDTRQQFRDDLQAEFNRRYS